MNVARVTAAAVIALSVGGAELAAQQSTDSASARLQRQVDSLKAAMSALSARLDTASIGAPQPAAAAPARTGGAYMNVGFVSDADAGWSTQQDPTVLQHGDHDPKVRGFTMPNSEISLDGAVDPYFKGYSNIVWKLDQNGETEVELEEAYGITTSLPGNLQLKFGQFFTEFGRQNNQHPHAWAFVDQPIVLTNMFGKDGLRSQGARLSWLAPWSFYTEAMLTVANSGGGTLFSFRSDESSEIHGGETVDRGVNGFKDLLIAPRVSSSFDIGETQAMVVGGSGAFGPNNAGTTTRTSIYGADLYWKWKSLTAAQGFPFVSFQSEVMTRAYDAGSRVSLAIPAVTLAAQTLHDNGAYAQLLWGIKPRIVAGLRGDWTNGDAVAFDSPARADRIRISPNFTWYPTEFSKIRLQYNYDDRKDIKTDHSLWLQFEFLLGAHAAHKF
jgi:hypothetical protein